MVEDILRGKIDLKDSDLDKLSRAAEKAKRILAKAKVRVTGSEKKTSGKTFEGLLKSDLGTKRAGNLLAVAGNPVGFVTNILTRQLPILGGILAAAKIVTFIAKELQKRGGLLDRFFRDVIKTRLDALRNKGIQQEILIGKTQLIITTRAGTTNPRDAYNTFQLAREEREKLEEDFSVRSLGETD